MPGNLPEILGPVFNNIRYRKILHSGAHFIPVAFTSFAEVTGWVKYFYDHLKCLKVICILHYTKGFTDNYRQPHGI